MGRAPGIPESLAPEQGLEPVPVPSAVKELTVEPLRASMKRPCRWEVNSLAIHRYRRSLLRAW